jgi:hypothetical protein
VYLRFQADGFAKPLVLTESQEGMAVQKMLSWALEGELHGSQTAWPEILPRPQLQPVDDQNKLTNEVFYGAIGFAVLHEIGHIARNHSGDNLPRDIHYRHEFEADEWAYDWIMDQWRSLSNDEKVYRKRVTLIATLYAVIGAPQLYQKRVVATSKHPNTIDRLERFLTKHANEDCGLDVGLAWAVPATALHLHVAQVVPEPLPRFDSWRNYFNAIRDLFDQKEPIRAN